MKSKKITSYLLSGIFLFSLARLFQGYLIVKLPTTGIFCVRNFLGLKIYHNSDLAFGIPFSNNLLIILNIIVIIFLTEFLRQFFIKQQQIKIISIILILTGAFSNLIDRIKFGYVIDYFYIWIFPVFNLADFLIIIGALLLIITWRKNEDS